MGKSQNAAPVSSIYSFATIRTHCTRRCTLGIVKQESTVDIKSIINRFGRDGKELLIDETTFLFVGKEIEGLMSYRAITGRVIQGKCWFSAFVGEFHQSERKYLSRSGSIIHARCSEPRFRPYICVVFDAKYSCVPSVGLEVQ